MKITEKESVLNGMHEMYEKAFSMHLSLLASNDIEGALRAIEVCVAINKQTRLIVSM